MRITPRQYAEHMARMGQGVAAPAKARKKKGEGDYAKRKAWELEQMSKSGLFVPVRIVSEANCGRGWRDRMPRRRDQGLAVFAVLKNAKQGMDIGHGKRVTFIRLGRKLIDCDNLAYSFKKCRDEVANWFGVDDGRKDLWQWVYDQEPGHPFYGVRIVIEERGDGCSE
jgi:hypothetical protein